jgi:hypothetical protein
MADYRYCFLEQDGSIRGGINVECEDDGHALAGATKVKHHNGMEVWQGDRRVWRLPRHRRTRTSAPA